MKLVLCVAISLVVCLSAEAAQYELFEIKGKVGLKDESGKIVLPASFERLGWSDGSFSVIGQTTGYKLNNQWGLVNLNTEFITKPIYETLENSGGYLLVARKKVNAIEYKNGCIDLHSEVAVPFIYDGIKIVGLAAIVFKKNAAHFNYGLISLKNEVIIPLNYAYIFALGSSRFGVENSSGQVSIFSDQGKAITPFSLDSISNYQHGFAIFYQGFRQGLLNTNGDIVIESVYKKIEISTDGLLLGQLPSQCNIISGDNQVLNKIEADGLTNSYRNLYKIKRGNVVGLLDEQLNPVLTPQYEILQEIGNNHFIAKKKRYGIIRVDNSIVLPLAFDSLLVDGELVRAKEKAITKTIAAKS